MSRIGDTKAFPAPRSERKEKKGEKGGPAEEGIVDKVRQTLQKRLSHPGIVF